MSLKIKTPRAQLTLSERTIELRRQVERLEFARREAQLKHDSLQVEIIDKQISDVSKEWAASFAADHEERVRKAG
jgi:hypothetical protein